MNFFRTTILFFAIASFAPDAFGQSVWTGGGAFDDFGGNGLWATPTNWAPFGEPTGAASISVTVTIALPGTNTALGNLNIATGTVTLDATTSAFSPNSIVVDTGGILNLNVPTGGTVTTANVATLAAPAASNLIGDGNGQGTFNLTGGGTLTMTTGGASTGVGVGGTGTFSQSGTTAVSAQSGLYLGIDGNVSKPPSISTGSTTALGGTGTYNLGGTATLTSPTIFIGVGSGLGGGTTTGGATPTLGTLNITSTSATALSAGSVFLGVDANANTTPTTAAVGNPIANTTGIVNQSAGTATITGSLFVGYAPGGVGAYNLSGTGILSAPTITIGDFAAVPAAGGAPAIAGASGSFTQLAGTVGTTTLTVGAGGTGSYALQGGVLTVASTFTVGGTAGSSGTFTQSSGTTFIDNGTFSIGTGGTGIFNYNGGTFTLSAGAAIGSTGTFNQDASITITSAKPFALASGGTYSLNGGTLTTGGSTSITGTADASNFNFGGGTIAITGSAWTDPFLGSITGTSTINTALFGATLSGNLSGTGTLDITGGKTVTLSGTNNVTDSWGATITGGSTLNATSVTNLSTTGTYAIGTGSTFNLLSSSTLAIFHGNISSITDIAGQAKLNTGTGKLVLAGVTNLSTSSTTTIGAGGILQVNQGTISNVNGSAGLSTNTFIIGSGNTTGTVSLLGSTTTNLLPTVTVNANSTLFAGGIGGSVTNSGTLGTFGSPAAPMPLLITGSLTSTGTLLVNANGTSADSFGTSATKLTAATLSGIVNVTGVGALANYPIVTSNTAIVTTLGTTAGDLTTNPPTALYSSHLSENAGHTQLLLTTVQGPLLPFATTPNQAAVANALDPILQQPPAVFVPILTILNQLPVGTTAIGTDLDELSPEVLQYSRDISFENSTFLAVKLDNAMADLRNGATGLDTNGIGVITPGFDSGLGRSLGSLLAYSPFHSAAPNGVNYYPGGDESASPYPSSAPLSPRASSSPESDTSGETISDSPIQLKTSSEAPVLRTPPINEFFGADIVLSDLNQSQSVSNAAPTKANYTAADAIAGVSFRMTSNLSAGILFDYNHTDAKTDSFGSKTTVDTYSPGVFATYSTHGFYTNALFAFGLNNYSNTRDIAFLGNTANSSPSGQQYVTNLDFGYDFHPDPKWTCGPTLGVIYTHLDIDSFSETGAGPADLMVSSQNIDSLRSRLGGHLGYQTHTGSVLFQPNISAMWQHEYLDNSNGITSQFNIPGTGPFTIQAASATKDSALIGCGVTATLDNSMALYLNYMADIGMNDYFAQTVMGGFKANF